MEELLNVAYGFIEGIDKFWNFLINPIEVNVLGFNLISITPIYIMSIGGLIFLFTYYLIRGLTI